MRFLHTSDLHIGKRLDRVDKKSRIEEQKKVIDNLVSIANEKEVDVVLIAGDVYDTFIPSAEAEALFFDMLYKLSRLNVLTIIISGNHDDEERLTASKQISAFGGAFFAGSNFAFEKKIGQIEVENSGEDFIILKKGDESVFVSLLPYPTEYRMKEKLDEEETYENKVSRYIQKSLENNKENLPVILVSHIFMLGGVSTSGERAIELGGARILPQSIIPSCCIYTALGHIHKRQVLNKYRNIIYSGSIMPFTFDEANSQKSVTVFDVVSGKVQNLEEVKLSGYKELLRLCASSIEEAMQILEPYREYFVELTLKLENIVSGESLKQLSACYPNVKINLEYTANEKIEVKRRSAMTDKEIFIEFYKSKFSTEPPFELVDLFLETLNQGGGSDETY